jgi:hypothetical protein
MRRFTGMTIKSTLFLFATLAAAAAGCATDDAHDFDQLAAVTSFTGTTVELFTAGDGYMAVEYGDKDLPRALPDVRGLSLADAYRAATRHEPPAELAARSEVMANHAAERTGATALSYVVDRSKPLPAAPGVVYSTGSCSAQWMQDHGWCTAGSGTDWELLNWWNGAYEHLGGVNHSSAALCADIGSVVWEIHNGDGGNHTWTLLQGQLLTYGLSTDDWFGTWLDYDVTHATNNRFQFCGWAS